MKYLYLCCTSKRFDRYFVPHAAFFRVIYLTLLNTFEYFNTQ